MPSVYSTVLKAHILNMRPNKLVGPFEEKEEGVIVTSHGVKDKGEDPDTPGYKRGDRMRRDVSDFQSWVHPSR